MLHLWSLAIEEQFYFVWPILLLVGLRFFRSRKWLIASILLVALVSIFDMAFLYRPGLMDTSRIYYGTDTRVFAILIGAALAVCLPSQSLIGQPFNNKRSQTTLDIAGTIGVVSLLWLFWKVNEYDEFLYPVGMVIQCIATVAIVIAAAHPFTWLSRILGCKLLRWLGIRSYGIYIWHYPILMLTFTSTKASEGQSFTQIVIQILVTLIIADFSWRFVEKPILNKIRSNT